MSVDPILRRDRLPSRGQGGGAGGGAGGGGCRLASYGSVEELALYKGPYSRSRSHYSRRARVVSGRSQGVQMSRVMWWSSYRRGRYRYAVCRRRPRVLHYGVRYGGYDSLCRG